LEFSEQLLWITSIVKEDMITTKDPKIFFF
jgi:hypothetical protein